MDRTGKPTAVEFRMKAAGHTVVVRAMYDSTRRFCADYLCAEEAEIDVEITEADITFEQKHSGNASDDYLEFIALLRKVSEELIEYDTLLFHGSCIAVDGIGYLFTAPSGTGKSTHTRLWRQLLGDRAVMINDDKPFLEIREDGVTAWGSPWNGKHRLDTNTGVPMKAICVLERGEENEIRRIPAKEAIMELFQQSARPRDPGRMGRYMDLLDKLAGQVTFYRMHCNMAPEAAVMAYNTMTGTAREYICNTDVNAEVRTYIL